jgi:EpsI family protein
MQMVFLSERRPGRGEFDEVHLRRKTPYQWPGMRLRDERHARMARRLPQEGHGQRQVAQAPKLEDQQAGGWRRKWRRFCQACRVKFSIARVTSNADSVPAPPRPNYAVAAACAVVGIVLFQFFGNASRGYINTPSLFYWWVSQWWNPDSELEHAWLVLGISGWLLWRNMRIPDFGLRIANPETPNSKPQTPNKHPTQNSEPKTHNLVAPAAALLAALALHAVGFVAQQGRISIVALLLFAWGVLRLAGGLRWGRAAVFPLGFLAFAIPVDVLDSVGFWLRMWVINVSTPAAHALGIGVLQSGTQLLAPDGRYNYDVAAACSGIRSLTALAALSLLAGYLSFHSWWRRAVIVLLCFPLVYVGNLARILSIIVAAQLGGQVWGDRAHGAMGFGVFVIVLGGVLAGIWALERFAPESPRSPTVGGGPVCHPLDDKLSGSAVGGGRGDCHPLDDKLARLSSAAAAGDCHLLDDKPAGFPSAEAGAHCHLMDDKRTWAVAGTVVLLALVEMVFLHHLTTIPPRGGAGIRLDASGLNPADLPAFIGTEWAGQRAEVTAFEREILPADTGYSRRNYVNLTNPAQQVFFSVVLSGRDRSSIHRPEICLVGQGWTISARTEQQFHLPGGKPFSATLLRVRRVQAIAAGGARAGGPLEVPQVVAYWFVSANRIVATHWQRFAVDAWNRVVHGQADRWAYVLVQTDARDGEAAALARIQTVLDGTLPALLPGSARP